MAATENKKFVCRDSIDGRFITKKQAEKSPATTEKQRGNQKHQPGRGESKTGNLYKENGT